MHGRRLAALAPALALAAIAAVPAASGMAVTGATAPSGVERALVSAINAARSAHHLPALRLSPALARSARAHSASLLRAGRLEHEGPGGAPFWKRLVEAGYPSRRPMAENLALVPGCGAATAATAVRMWLQSPGHRTNMLSPRYRWVGPGAALSQSCGSAVYTADFGG
ncbi:MAG: hypothetical protein QOK40_2476 [Miltoncostaeaceae bacterium]|nr:hypothetical protein [Miltoncostaeaceae bacterium]